jgi:hypothetical protein
VNKPSPTGNKRTFARPLADLAIGTLADSFAKQGFASTELVTRWADIVGPEIAAHSQPEKIRWPRRDQQEAEPATLVLRVEGPAAIEIQHLASVVLERVNRFFGFQAVARLQFRQAPLSRRERKPPRKPDEAAVAAVAETLPGIKDDDLRQALARLGAAIKDR